MSLGCCGNYHFPREDQLSFSRRCVVAIGMQFPAGPLLFAIIGVAVNSRAPFPATCRIPRAEKRSVILITRDCEAAD